MTTIVSSIICIMEVSIYFLSKASISDLTLSMSLSLRYFTSSAASWAGCDRRWSTRSALVFGCSYDAFVRLSCWDLFLTAASGVADAFIDSDVTWNAEVSAGSTLEQRHFILSTACTALASWCCERTSVGKLTYCWACYCCVHLIICNYLTCSRDWGRKTDQVTVAEVKVHGLKFRNRAASAAGSSFCFYLNCSFSLS